MKRRQFPNRVNKNVNKNVFNHVKNKVPRNVIAPEIMVTHLWMQEDDPSGVEIVELNSSNDSESSEERRINYNQAWSFINNDKYIEEENDYHHINKKARERRRLTNKHNLYDSIKERHYNTREYYYDDSQQFPEVTSNHQRNCFTIINNHVINSDSSTEQDNADLKDPEPESPNPYWNHVYNDELVSSNPNVEKRTIWIYSFKNRRILSENDFELVNIPGKESISTSSCSVSDEEQKKDKSNNVNRIASPVPPSYIPRLNLSLGQTLSTVTELSELKHSEESSRETLNPKPFNNWFTERAKTKPNKTENENIVNWMGLSPRERRRIIKGIDKDITINKDNTFVFERKDLKRENTSKLKTSPIKVDVDVHVSNKDTPSKSVVDIEIDTNLKNDLRTEIVTSDIVDDIVINDEDNDIKNLNKPRIHVYAKAPKTFNTITSPIEKLDGNNWIVEDEIIKKETNDFEYSPGNNHNESVKSIDGEVNSASRRLYTQNLKLLKPSQWSEYLPITTSLASLHLSVSYTSLQEKKTWLKRISGCFKCFR